MEYESNKRFPLDAKDYKLHEEVGEGVSASVYRALCIPLNEIVAIKVLDLEKCNNDLDGIRREVNTMTLIKHQNLVRAHCSFTAGHNLWVVMPYMAGGSCVHIMKSSYPEGFEEPVIATLLNEVLKALVYLHAQGDIHRDVKAGNILIDSNGAVKLADFGVSACMFDAGDRQRSRNTFVGTPCWMAPEVMQQLPAVIRNQQGNLSANGNMYMGEEANAFPSASNDMMASGAASLIASNGLSNLVQPGTLATQTPGGPNMPGLYSTTGFDIVSVLAKVANRKDPKTVLGPVDCSCSFVVSDVRKFDCPIVYTSPTFSQLTGYDAREILGRNCRFLQSPDGEVAKGSRRKYTDNVAVAHMKRLLQAGKECQASLINYRKGGTPFINLVTVVPITWDSDEVVYHVGFQVDLVEQPNAILRNMRDGSYQVNYTVQNNPQPPLKPAAKPAPEPLPPSSIGISQEMLRLLPPKTQTAVLAGGEEAGKSEWLRLVLANTDDFVHVLSLKGQFQYVSPSVRRVLEYEPEDLLNKHISDICHPSDIVPVMRELKDATHTPSDGRQPQAINMLFRVRRKLSGYIWLESSGRLQVESGKGRKAMVLTGRDRTLPAFCWKALDDHGGLTDTEVWAKVSLDGLVLWVTGCVGDIFGGRTNDLVGKSIYSFMAGAEDGPPGPDGHSSSLAVEKAISTSAEGLPKRGATSVRHQLIGLDGRTREVTSNFFAAGSSSAGPITPSRESPTASDDDVRSNVSSFMDDLPFQILVQIKSTPTGIQKPKSAIVHPLTENVFEEMDTTRGTSWQYELHQLKIANRKLKDDIQALRTGQKSNKSSDVEDDSKRAKAKKRKANETGPQPTTDHPTPLHQQTPGFGLAPGRVFKTWS